MRKDRYFVQSWRAPAECIHRWHQPLFESYWLLKHALSDTAAGIKKLPWICGETGAHEAYCESKPKAGVTMLITISRNGSEGYLRLIEQACGR